MRLIWTYATIGILTYIIYSFPHAPLISLISSIYHDLNVRLDGLPGALVAAVVTGTIAVIAFQTNAAVNIRNKRMDVVIHCNARYDDLYKLRHDIDKEDNIDVKIHLVRSYFRRYWGLQSDQIDYWLAGYVDPETMASWVVSLTSSLKNKDIGDEYYRLSYEESWDEQMREVHRVANERLTETVDFSRLFLAPIVDPKRQFSATLQYLRIVEANERSLIKRLSRDHHRRMNIDDLAITIRDRYWKEYNDLDVRNPLVKLPYRMTSNISRVLSAIPDWVAGNRMRKLKRSLLPDILQGRRSVSSDILLAQLSDRMYDHGSDHRP